MNQLIDKYEKYKLMSKKDINEEYRIAAENHENDLVKYLLSSEELKNNADIYYKENYIFHNYCQSQKKESLEMVEYMLYSKKLKKLININYRDEELKEDDTALMLAAYKNCIDVVKLLLTNNNGARCNISSNDNQAIINAVQNGSKEVVEYLLTSEDLEIHSDIYAQNCKAIESGIKNKEYETLSYLVNVYGIKKTDRINELIKNDELIEKWFSLRNLNKKLNSKLEDKEIKIKKIKV